MRHLSRIRAALVVAGLLAAATASADEVYGPHLFVETSPGVIFNDTFKLPAAAGGYLWVFNGDASGARVSAGSITVNGKVLVKDVDFAKATTPQILKPVAILTDNTIDIQLNGDVGSYITVVVMKGGLPNVSAGRLFLPWASSTGFALAITNAARIDQRDAVIIAYDGSGALAASSQLLTISPLSATVSDTGNNLIGTWTNGSIEVFYAGKGPGRVFAQASVTDPSTSTTSVVHLDRAGHRRYDPTHQAIDDAN